jgi:hypothetical protein
MPAAAVQQHKFSKGDKLPEIARKYGHGDASAIWRFPGNKSLVAKRRKPEALEPGDLLAIPPTAKELQAEKARIAALDKAIAAEWALDGALTMISRRLDQRRAPVLDAQASLDRLDLQVAAIVDGLCKSLPAAPDAVNAARRAVQAGAAVQAACKAELAKVQSAAGKLASLTVGLRAVITKDLVFGGTGDIIELDIDIVQHERAVADLLDSLADPWKDLNRSAWWAGHALALRDLPTWNPDAPSTVIDAIGDAAADAAKTCASLRRELDRRFADVQSLLRGVEMLQKMAEMRRLQAGMLRTAKG